MQRKRIASFFICSILLSGLLLLSSCDPAAIKCTPDFSKHELFFSKEGGEEKVGMEVFGGARWERTCPPDWGPGGEKAFYRVKDSTGLIRSKYVEITRDTIEDRVRIHFDWVEIEYSLYVPKKVIVVRTRPNPTPEKRLIHFTVGRKHQSNKLNIYQD